MPLTGHFPMVEGELRRRLSPGPLARRAEDLMPVLRIIAGPDGVDPYTVRMRLGEPSEVAIRGLPVVVSIHSSTVPLRPVIRRRIEEAAAALESRGAVVRTAPLKNLRGALAQFGATVLSEIDLLNSWLAITAPTTRPADDHRAPLLVRGPAAVLRLVEAAPSRAVRTAAARRVVDSAARAQDALIETIGDGVLLYPPFPRLAPKHRHTVAQPWLATNTAVFNLFGLPATQIPLGLHDSWLPLGVQAVAAPGNDHVCIATALELERAFGGWVDPLSR